MCTLARPLLFIVPVLICGAFSEISVGEQARKAPTPACALLSVAEIRKITGRDNYPDHVDGDPLGEGAGGGSSCQYGGEAFMPGDHPPMLSLVLIPGKGWTERSRSFKLREGCKKGVRGGGWRRRVLRVLSEPEIEAVRTALCQGGHERSHRSAGH